MKRLAAIKKQTGFGLLHVAILLMIIGGLASYMLKPLAPQTPTKSNELALKKADKLLQDFITINGRLPCVDTTGDGVEDCSANSVKGALPYLTLGMTSAGFSAGDAPIKYGVYRNANNTAVKNGGIDRVATSDANAISLLSNDADLATLKNRYQPTMAGGYSFNFTDAANQNSLDFCQALKAAETSAFSNTRLYVQTPSGSQKNVAYALSMGGRYDGDNDGDLNDGLNASSTTAFNSSGTFLSSVYDDYVINRSFSELQEKLQCDVVMQSLNMVANSVLMEKEVKDQAEDMADAAVEGAIMAGINVAVIAYSVVLAAVDLANASATLGVASGLLSGAVASCVVLVGCAFIPVYTASVVAAGIGVGLAGVAVGAGAAAGISQAVATGLYIDIAVRANAAVPDDVVSTTSNPDYSATITALNAEKTVAINEASAARSDANTKLSAASTALNTANQRFTDMYYEASVVSARNGGALPNTYATEQDYTDAVNNLETKSNAFKTAVNDEYAKLQDYRDKAAIAAGLEEDCNNTSCVIPQSAFDGLAPDDPPPSCPAGGTPDQSSTACQDYATAQTTADDANLLYQAAKTATNNAYSAAYQAALDHPVYIPEVKDTDGNLVSAATTVRCEDYPGCDFTPDLLSAAGNVIDYHAFVPADENDTFTVISGSYIDAILIKQSLADSADNYATEKESNLTDLQNNIDSMQCMQDGNYWDGTTLVCSTTPSTGTSSGITLLQGGENILKDADRHGVLR
ncbi:hypothetical protein THMIRHAM_20900 [Thiomicrorhabdus immobilis]|uniref:Uncharacterized protein n=1 Tax=Thiomicrorhabdus immobilis TaxID=2791037 RepID=A0ABN6D2E6_9GAMM|nr:hypothetical protein [Thiomicrorhabdus immobilis]BCN94305.1 hypothetical protein THMIRHAM_20900 [Thiomicrorhabdus immobilis]